MQKNLSKLAQSVIIVLVAQWSLLLISYLLYNLEGSMINLLHAEFIFSPSIDNFLGFVEGFLGRPVMLSWSSYSFWDPLSFIVVCVLPFWVFCGVIYGALSKNMHSCIAYCTIPTFSLIGLVILLGRFFDGAITLLGVLTTFVVAVMTYRFREN